MRARLLFLPLLAGLAAPTLAADLALVQPGDREKSCTALAGEINDLASAPAAVATPPVPKHKGFGGLAKAFGSAIPLLGSAVPVLGMVGGAGGAALIQAVGVAGSMGAQSSGHDATADARRDAGDMMQREERKQRLLAIFEEKKC